VDILNFIPAIAFAVFMGRKSSQKGYNFLCWVFSGMIGFIVLLFLPDTTRPELANEEQLRLQTVGNRIGLFLSLFVAVILVLLFINVNQK
jgi:amino acid permease